MNRVWAMVAVLGLAAVLGCEKRAQEVVLDLADVAPIQALQVAIDRIDPAMETGLDRLGSGWKIENESGKKPHLQVQGSEAVLGFFSPEAGLGDLVLVPFSQGPVPAFDIRLNGWVGKVARASALAIRLEAVPFKEGWNRLAIYPEAGSETLRLSSISLPHSGSSLAVGPGARMEVRRMGTSEESVIEMPVGSRLEWVVKVPDRAIWKARVRTVSDDVVTARAELLLPDGKVREIFTTTKSSGSFSVDLSLFEGELLGLRLSVHGSAAASAHWSQAQIVAVKREALPAAKPSVALRLDRPDVVVILLDAARADAFGAYGGSFATPAIDALAAEGTRFDRAWAPSSWTGQSVPSLLTGRTPEALQIETWGDPLSREIPILPGLMRAAGYRTLLWSHHPMYRTHRSHTRGFDRTVFPRTRNEVPDAGLLLGGKAPVFAWIHLLPPHTPYHPPPEFLGLYSEGALDDPRLEPEFLNSFPVFRQEENLNPGDLELIRGRYGEMVSFADDLVGKIVNALKAQGRYRDALVIVLADHGEAFLEHGTFMHTSTLHKEMLEVPWIVKWPAGTSGFRKVVSEPVSLLDLFPTLSSALGLVAEDRPSDQAGLLPLLFDGAEAPSPIWAFTHGVSRRRHRSRPSVAVELDGWKGILRRMDHRLLLYRTTDDRSELDDLSAELPLRARWLRQLIQAEHYATRRALTSEDSENGELDAEVSSQLEALGYL